MNQGRYGQWVSCFLDLLKPWFPLKLVSEVSIDKGKWNLGNWEARCQVSEEHGEHDALISRHLETKGY